jgi:SAM-dependent methyltransferase
MKRPRRSGRLARMVSTSHTATLEPRMVALYEAVLDELEIREGTRVLDIGQGAGLFLQLAAQRGATVAGIDADASLPFPDGSFDVVTGFDGLQSAADPDAALREAARVGRRGAAIVIAAWGRPDQCEAAAYVKALGSPGAADPFALAEPGALAAFAARGGLIAGERREVPCVWSFPDAATLLRAAGEDSVTRAILEAVAPYRTSDGGYRLENVFNYTIAHR